jgi:phosphoglycolate phosphatase
VIGYVLRETGTDAADCVMVGDRRHDAEGAARYGIPTVGVLWGYGSEEELRSAGCSVLAQAAEELVQRICTIG